MRSTRSALLAASALAMMGGLASPAQPLRAQGHGNNRMPTPPRMDTELQREIAAHNAEVERRKAEKKARKMARKEAE